VNGVTTRYVNDVAAPLAQVLEERRPGQTTRYAGGVGLEVDGQWGYQHADALGSVRQFSDPAGQVVQTRGYTPFGQARYAVGLPSGTFITKWLRLR
jgi:hypothetical protein